MILFCPLTLGDDRITKKQMRVKVNVSSNSGGSCKTTTSIHLAYELAKAGKTVTIIELDSNGSVGTFCGLDYDPPAERTLKHVWNEDFSGDYPFEPIWAEYVPGIQVIRGGRHVEKIGREIPSHGRGYYFLADRLKEFPINTDVIIFDNPGTLDMLAIPSYIASDWTLCPLKPEAKDADKVIELLGWMKRKNREFQLDPTPQMLGFVPTRVDYRRSVHRNILGVDKNGEVLAADKMPEDALPIVLAGQNIPLFPAIRDSAHYLTACQNGCPVSALNERNEDYKPIADKILSLL